MKFADIARAAELADTLGRREADWRQAQSGIELSSDPGKDRYSAHAFAPSEATRERIRLAVLNDAKAQWAAAAAELASIGITALPSAPWESAEATDGGAR